MNYEEQGEIEDVKVIEMPCRVDQQVTIVQDNPPEIQQHLVRLKKHWTMTAEERKAFVRARTAEIAAKSEPKDAMPALRLMAEDPEVALRGSGAPTVALQMNFSQQAQEVLMKLPELEAESEKKE